MLLAFSQYTAKIAVSRHTVSPHLAYTFQQHNYILKMLRSFTSLRPLATRKGCARVISGIFSVQTRCLTPEQMAGLVLSQMATKKPKQISASPNRQEHSETRVAAHRHASNLSKFSLPPAGTPVPGEASALPIIPSKGQAVRSSDVRLYPMYVCAWCAKPLFSLAPEHCSPTSSHGHHMTGWPSFIRPIEVESVTISTSESLPSMPIRESAGESGEPLLADADDANTNGLTRNRGEFKADADSVTTVGTPIDSADEIRRRHSRIRYDEYGNMAEKRVMLNKIKVSKRLWKGSRGDAIHSSTVFKGLCGGCKEDVCFVSLPAGRMPSFVVSAEKVRCVSPNQLGTELNTDDQSAPI